MIWAPCLHDLGSGLIYMSPVLGLRLMVMAEAQEKLLEILSPPETQV